jgi:phosphoserine phosphatase
MARRTRFSQNTIAIIYDFDGTLSPQPMQEYTVLPQLRMKPKNFWEQVKRENKQQKAVEIITYMRLMYDLLNQKSIPIKRRDLKALAKKIKYFPGVESWFSNINKYVAKHSKNKVKVHHYIISSGLKEILEGTKIYRHLKRAYGSEYFFNHYGQATFINRVITDSSKTQYLFRICKGKEDLSQSVNDHMPQSQRPIPFKNIIYFGDGDTDVPSMAVTRTQGGHAIAVYNPNHQTKKCKDLMKAGRIDFFAPADYRKGRDLWTKTTSIVDKIIASIAYDREVFIAVRKSSR